MQYKDINKIFSEAVAKTLAEGYTICTNTMGGSQGEIAFVNFTDKEGNHYSLSMDTESGHWDEDNFLDYIVIRFVRSKELKGDLKGSKHVTFWRADRYVEVIGERKFYEVSRRGDYFVEEEAEAKSICERRKKHWKQENKSDYHFEFEIPMNSRTRKMVSKFWKAGKQRWEKSIKQTDINSAKIIRDGAGCARLFVNNAQSVSIRYAA